MATKFKIHGQRSQFRADSRHKVYDLKRRNDEELGPIATFRGSIRWQRVRLRQVQANPTCCDPFKDHEREGLPVLAQSVHHIIGLLECLRLGQLDRLGCVPDNLRSVCTLCHNRIEGILDREGEAAAKRIFITEQEEEQIIQLVL